MSKIHTYYLPTYLKEKAPSDTRCTLILHRYQQYHTKSGKLATKHMMDAVEYPDEATMVKAIEDEHMQELPAEADGQPGYVPAAMKSQFIRKVAKL